jgi:hypothetical protein
MLEQEQCVRDLTNLATCAKCLLDGEGVGIGKEAKMAHPEFVRTQTHVAHFHYQPSAPQR